MMSAGVPARGDRLPRRTSFLVRAQAAVKVRAELLGTALLCLGLGPLGPKRLRGADELRGKRLEELSSLGLLALEGTRQLGEQNLAGLEVRKLLEEGKITSGEDFSDAALIFQHGQTPEDFLFAHVLAVEALIRGGSADKWLAAATLDRYLQALNQAQIFGTQYPGDKASGNTPKPQVDPHVINIQRTQQPYDAKLLPDSVRQDFCVPDVSQQEKNLSIFNTGHRPEGKLMRVATCSD